MGPFGSQYPSSPTKFTPLMHTSFPKFRYMPSIGVSGRTRTRYPVVHQRHGAVSIFQSWFFPRVQHAKYIGGPWM
jgi:hypothetical protein